MAILPNGDDGSNWQITLIEGIIHIIKYPGTEVEEVVFKFKVNRHKIFSFLRELEDTKKLNQVQKYECMFWTGYFYGSL